jgi:hypothetical protein
MVDDEIARDRTSPHIKLAAARLIKNDGEEVLVT